LRADAQRHLIELTGDIVKLRTLPGASVPAPFQSSVKVVAGVRFILRLAPAHAKATIDRLAGSVEVEAPGHCGRRRCVAATSLSRPGGGRLSGYGAVGGGRRCRPTTTAEW